MKIALNCSICEESHSELCSFFSQLTNKFFISFIIVLFFSLADFLFTSSVHKKICKLKSKFSFLCLFDFLLSLFVPFYSFWKISSKEFISHFNKSFLKCLHSFTVERPLGIHELSFHCFLSHNVMNRTVHDLACFIFIAWWTNYLINFEIFPYWMKWKFWISVWRWSFLC